jgi:uncharacterized protein (DUF2235 family)
MRAFRETFARPVRRVRFLGLFDTVNSVPRFEQAWLNRSSGFPYTARSKSSSFVVLRSILLTPIGSARVIRHAVGIDERRAKFRQDLINKIDVSELQRQRTWKATRNDRKKKNKKSKFLSRSSNSINKSQHSVGNSMRNGHTNAGHAVYGQQLGGPESMGAVNPAATESLVSLNILMDYESDSEDDDDWEQNIEEVWFPGAHGDIGGGWDLPADEEPLSQGPLVWMVCASFKFPSSKF